MPFEILSIRHFLCIVGCILFIVLIPRALALANHSVIRYVIFLYIALICHLQFLELHVFTEMYEREWKTILPFQLCDFSAIAMVIYFLTKYRFAFSCAYFLGYPFCRHGYVYTKFSLCVPIPRLFSASVWTCNRLVRRFNGNAIVWRQACPKGCAQCFDIYNWSAASYLSD